MVQTRSVPLKGPSRFRRKRLLAGLQIASRVGADMINEGLPWLRLLVARPRIALGDRAVPPDTVLVLESLLLVLVLAHRAKLARLVELRGTGLFRGIVDANAGIGALERSHFDYLRLLNSIPYADAATVRPRTEPPPP